MSTTAENLRELLPGAEPAPPPNLLPELPAPPGVTVNGPPSPAPQLMGATPSTVQPRETTSGQMRELLSESNPYIQQARGGAQRYAASRGLQNSSIAGQGGEQAAIASALPIAQSDAGTYERRELTRVGAENTLNLARQQGDITSRIQSEGHIQSLAQLAAQGDVNARLQLEQHRQQLEQLAAQGDVNARLQLQRHEQILGEIGAQGGVQLQLQERENANRQWLAQFDATTQQNLLSLDLAGRERLQQAGFTQQQIVQQAEIAARERLQQAETANQQWLAQFDATTRERLQGLDADVRQAMQGLDLEVQERIAGMNVSAAERGDAARMAVSMELAYSSMLQTIMNNPDIPAEERQVYMDHASTVRDSNLAFVEQMFGFDLEW